MSVHRLSLLGLILLSECSLAYGHPLEHLYFETSSGERFSGKPSKTHEVAVDDSMEIRIDEAGLLAEVRKGTVTAVTVGSLAPRIQTLEKIAESLLRTQESLIAREAASIALEAARGSAKMTEARREFEVAHASYANIAVPALSDLDILFDADAELKASLGPAVYKGVLEEDYGQLAGTLTQYMKQVGVELGRKAENAEHLSVLLEATISDGALRRQRVHLDGYDDISTGEPVPFPRFQLALDDRAKEEFAASEKLSTTVNQLLDGSFEKQLKASLASMQRALSELVRTVKVDILEAELNATLKAMIAARDESLSPAIAELVEIRDMVAGLDKLPAVDDAKKLDVLLGLASVLVTKASQIEALTMHAPGRFAKFAATIESLAKDKPEFASARLRETIIASKDSLARELIPLQKIFAELREIGRAIGITADVVTAANDIVSRPKELGVGASLDSRLDLQTIKGWQRHPGDQLSLTVKVFPKSTNPEKGPISAFGRQKLRVETYGPHLQSRGALLFVDSRTGTVQKQSFEAAPGAAFHLKWGFKNQTWWNEWLAPGFGMSLALLNFDTNKNFELGIAGSVTLIRDMFWGGYGRNLQAKADYFFVGINPIALSSLYRQKVQ